MNQDSIFSRLEMTCHGDDYVAFVGLNKSTFDRELVVFRWGTTLEQLKSIEVGKKGVPFGLQCGPGRIELVWRESYSRNPFSIATYKVSSNLEALSVRRPAAPLSQFMSKDFNHSFKARPGTEVQTLGTLNGGQAVNLQIESSEHTEAGRGLWHMRTVQLKVIQQKDKKALRTISVAADSYLEAAD